MGCRFSVKTREERQKVMIRARMRSGLQWQDVCILNLSSHGVGIQTAAPPERGAYVEIRRGPNVIIARVAWAKGHRVGLKSQDPIFIPAIVKETPVAPAPGAPATARPVERRRQRRHGSAHDDSRFKARALEFAGFAAAAVLLAAILFGAVEQSLAQPLSRITAALGED